VVAGRVDTGGHLALMEQRAPRGFSPPRHVHHREDTALLVLDGAITAVVGDERVELGPGGFVWLSRDVPHTFQVDSETAHQIELATPAGFEEFRLEASNPAPALELPPPGEPDIPRVLATADGCGVEIVGPPLGPKDRPSPSLVRPAGAL
jgi:mannose-6-phosphate isomerase-like protein (cupin superfamily)